MKKALEIPGKVWMYVIPGMVCFLLSLFATDALDIAIHDTYFVIAFSQVLGIAGYFYLCCAAIILGIRVSKRKWSPWLHWIHYVVCVPGFIVTAILCVWASDAHEPYRDYSVADEVQSYNQESAIMLLITALCVMFLLVQLLFLVNVIRAFVLPKK